MLNVKAAIHLIPSEFNVKCSHGATNPPTNITTTTSLLLITVTLSLSQAASLESLQMVVPSLPTSLWGLYYTTTYWAVLRFQQFDIRQFAIGFDLKCREGSI